MTWTDFGLQDPDFPALIQLTVRLVIACALGAVLGLEREARGRQAGLRTHMLVSLGCALFTVIPLQHEGAVGMGEIVKGLTAGIGFLGAGAIMKRESEQRISGITTAAGIWTTAAMGFAVGAGYIGAAIVCTAMAWAILYFLNAVAEPIRPDDDRQKA
jgi:putative Mg2+ transporter-C (MgtC) family protein